MALSVNTLNTDTLEALRGRGHTDDAIRGMTPERAFDEVCIWHGLIGWGPVLRHELEELNKNHEETTR